MFAVKALSICIALHLLLGWKLNNEGVEALALKERVRRQALTINTSKAAFTSAEKINIVKQHNTLRSSVSPTAKNMLYMTWREDIAAMAQTWANACNFAHGQPNVTTLPYSYIGQNLFASTDLNGYNETIAVTKWFSESANYTLSTNICKATSPYSCGHYTQVTWAASDRVGCGIKFCSKLGSSTMTNAYFVVCNYGPGGNVNKQPPYVSGTPCSGCPTTAASCYNSKLCKPTTLCTNPAVTCATKDADTCVCK